MEENTIHADAQNKRKKLISRIITVLIFVGFGLMFFCFPLFRKTIISEKFIIIIALVPSIIGAFLFKKIVDFSQGKKNNIFIHFILNVIVVGSISAMLFLVLNYFLASKEIKVEKFKITNKGNLVGSKKNRDKGEAYAMIQYKGEEKQIIFPFEETERVMASQNVILETRDGLFGKAIIVKKDLE